MSGSDGFPSSGSGGCADRRQRPVRGPARVRGALGLPGVGDERSSCVARRRQVFGRTRGSARRPGGSPTWAAHGQPRELPVYPLARAARERSCALDDGAGWRSEGDPRPWTASRLRSLGECPGAAAGFRGARGGHYPPATLPAIAVAAKLAGRHGVTAVAEFAQGLAQRQLRALMDALDPSGRVVTPDAMHARDATARRVVRGGAHYVMTAVESHRLDLLIDLQGLDWERPEVRAGEHGASDRGHGRREPRTCRVIDLTARSEAPLPHRRVAFRIERERRIRTTGKVRHETVHGPTSLPARRATPEAVLELVRGHWSIENRLHHVRDISYREDQCRVRTGHLPRNLACLTSLAISIVRIQGRVDHLPQAHRLDTHDEVGRGEPALRERPHPRPAPCPCPPSPRAHPSPSLYALIRPLTRKQCNLLKLKCFPPLMLFPVLDENSPPEAEPDSHSA